MRYIYWFFVFVWTLWSRVYRYFHKPPQETCIKKYNGINTLLEVCRGTKWIADGAWELFDAIGSSAMFQFYLDTATKPKSGRDCDDFAVYCHEVISRHMEKPYYVPCGMLSVTWWVPWFWKFKKPAGHAVCLLRDDFNYVHIGNWGLIRAAAYDPTDPHAGLVATAKSIADSKGCPIIGFALINEPELKPHGFVCETF